MNRSSHFHRPARGNHKRTKKALRAEEVMLRCLKRPVEQVPEPRGEGDLFEGDAG